MNCVAVRGKGYLARAVVWLDMLLLLSFWGFLQGCIQQRLPLPGELVQENNQGKAAVREAGDQEGNSAGDV